MTHSQSYTYNAASEVLSHTIDSEVINYGYDAASQLISEIRPGYSASYSYDRNGNRLTRTVNGFTEHYSYDDGDKMLFAGTLQFTYDAAGRRSTKRNHFGSVLETYVYDDEDRLVSRGNQNYSYNGFNTRTKITVNGGLTTEFHRDGVGVTSPVISEGNGGATKHVTPGISEKWGAGASKFMHGGLKDVNAWTDAAQSVTESNKYDAYGRALPGSSGWANRFGYGGKFGYQSDGGDLQLLGHRYYDSSTGTFITRDPIKDGRNWYSYCENNPVNAVDADGLKRTQVMPGTKEYQRISNAIDAIAKYDKESARLLREKLKNGEIFIDDSLGGASGRTDTDSSGKSIILLPPSVVNWSDRGNVGKGSNVKLSIHNSTYGYFQLQAILYHESLHVLYPDMKHSAVWEMQANYMKWLMRKIRQMYSGKSALFYFGQFDKAQKGAQEDANGYKRKGE